MERYREVWIMRELETLREKEKLRKARGNTNMLLYVMVQLLCSIKL